MKNPALITPSVMKWARETAGMSVKDAATRFAKSVAKNIIPQTVEDWESGERVPTYSQLEKIARAYERPVILFYFPKPPEEEPIEEKFRALPEARAKKLPPEIRFLVRRADVFRINLYELHEERNPIAQKIFDNISISSLSNMKETAADVRHYLNLPEAQQWKTPDKAFDARRNCLEKHGLSVFRESFKKEDDYSGFCLNDPQFPVIYINSRMSKSRQSFTLFHELAHILMKKGGVDFRNSIIDTGLKNEELICNQFAGEVLVPEEDVMKHLPLNGTFDDNTIKKLATRYMVSRAVILRKLRDINQIDFDFFDQKTAQLKREWEERSKSKASGYVNYANKIYSSRSKNYTHAAYTRYCRNLINEHEFADYLDVGTKHIDAIAQLAFRNIQTD